MKFTTLPYFLLLPFFLFSQVGINTKAPDFSSALHVESTTKGVLFPELTMTQRDAIATLVTTNGTSVPGGLTIFCSDCCSDGSGGTLGAMFYYNGIEWKSLDSDCSVVGAFPSSLTSTTSLLSSHHLSAAASFPLLFDDDITYAAQTTQSNLYIHEEGEDTIQFTLNEVVPVGGEIVIYWSDQLRMNDAGVYVTFKNGATTSQADVDTGPDLLSLPNSTNIVNTSGTANDYILTTELIAATDIITISASAVDDGGGDVVLLEFRVFDDNNVEIPITSN